MTGGDDRIRLDKWIWHARLVKSRGLAAGVIGAGHVRVNGAKITKAGRFVKAGDVLTVRIGERIRLLRILDCGERRGPATEAATLFVDMDAATTDE